MENALVSPSASSISTLGCILPSHDCHDCQSGRSLSTSSWILLPVPVTEVKELSITSLSAKDWDKGIEYLTLFLILSDTIPHNVQQRIKIFLAPSFIVNILMKTPFVFNINKNTFYYFSQRLPHWALVELLPFLFSLYDLPTSLYSSWYVCPLFQRS